MRVLVTGHNGYIGTVLVPLLKECGHDIVGLDSNLFNECTFGAPPLPVPELRKDIRDVQHRDLEGFEAVVHLAALSNDPLGDLRPEVTYEINYIASVRLARVSKEVGIPRFVFSSSCSTYGAAGDHHVDEQGALNPVTPYGRSKMLAEQRVAKLACSTFSPTFLRNATAYGVSPRLRFDLVLNNLVAWAFCTGHVHIKSDGTPWRPIVHIEDIARAVAAILEAPRALTHNQTFNVGQTKENYQIHTLAEIVEHVVPGCRIEYASDAGPDKRCYRVDCSKLERMLPTFRPRWDALRGARQLHEAYQRIGLRVEDFEGPRYKRIDHLKNLLQVGRLDSSLRWKGESDVIGTFNRTESLVA